MEDRSNLTDSVRTIKDQYLSSALSLNALVLRSEALLEQGKSLLSTEKHQGAMNGLYVLEEINALVLDEGRSMRADERLRVAVELEKLASLVANV